MDHGFTPPEPLVFEGNLAEQWKKWKQELNFYLIATEKSDKSDAIKSNILLTCIGKKGREVYNTFTFATDRDKMKFIKDYRENGPVLYIITLRSPGINFLLVAKEKVSHLIIL